MTLYVVATPIGHLSDLSDRARQVLRSVETVYAEDTRHSSPLMRSIGATAPLRSYHDFSDATRIDEVLSKLAEGLEVALISDAGTPCISDPGYRLVKAAREAGYKVSPVPGPSAVIAFLSASGLPTDQFQFLGFPPRKTDARRAWLEESLKKTATSVCYESPKRVEATLKELAEIAPARLVCVGRELTKIYEEFIYGSAADVASTISSDTTLRGEFVLGWEGQAEQNVDLEEADEWVKALQEIGVRTRDATKVVAARLGLRPKELYQRALARQSPE